MNKSELLCQPEGPMLQYGSYPEHFCYMMVARYDPPCECDCYEMLKPAKIYTWDPNENNVYLTYARHLENYPVLTCFNMELNISACNGHEISHVNLKFNSSSETCLYENMRIFVQDENGNFQPPDGLFFNPVEDINIDLYPPLQPCESRKYTIQLCTSCGIGSHSSSSNVTFEVSENPPCEKNLTFLYDFVTGIGPGGIIQTNYQQINSTNETYEYKILDVVETTVMSGTINSLVDLNKIIQELHINTGLYVVQVIKNGEILINDKITVVK